MKRIGMMSHRYLCAFVLGISVIATGSGCTHLMEARAISKFSDALLKEDYETLVASSSPEFESKALRQKQAIKEFKLLKFPKGKTSIDNVEEISETNKLVTVSVAGSKKKLNYHLIKDSKTNAWVVDDVMIQHKKNGESVTQSVMEQMNLLLSVREFVAAWSGNNKQDVLDVLSPEFQQEMSGLPDRSLYYLTNKAIGKTSKNFKAMPVAQIDGDEATVRLPRLSGELTLSYQRINEQWKINNVSLDSNDTSDANSFRMMVNGMRSATNFIAAFQNNDHAQLKLLTASKFYTGSLAPADLSVVSVPGLQNKENKIEIKVFGEQAEFTIENKKQLVKINLTFDEKPNPNKKMTSSLKVNEVTIYNLETGEEKRLSALFTAHAMIDFFVDGIASRNIDLLRKTSTVDFNKRVWNKLTDRAVKQFPLDDIGNHKPRVLETKFKGAITHVTVMQGDRKLTYVLRDHQGELHVDDVLVPIVGKPKSFKESMEMTIPVRQFAAAIGTKNISDAKRVRLLQRTSSHNFNRLIWQQVQGMPVMAMVVPHYMNGPIRRIEPGNEVSYVTIGDSHHGAKITITNEQDGFVVDDVELISGTAPEQHAMLKKTMMKSMSEGGLTLVQKTTTKRSAVVSADYQEAKKTTQEMSEEELLQNLSQSGGAIQQTGINNMPSRMNTKQTYRRTMPPQVDYSRQPLPPASSDSGDVMLTPKGRTIRGIPSRTSRQLSKEDASMNSIFYGRKRTRSKSPLPPF